MFLDLAITISIATPIVFVFMVLYIQALLGVARYFNGILKFLLSMVFYIIFAVVIVAPLVFLIDNIRIQLNESTWYLLLIIFAYGIIVAPSFIYLKNKKLDVLQKAGYFLNFKRDKIQLAVLFTPFTYFSQLYFAP
jgi:hypothetical protein